MCSSALDHDKFFKKSFLKVPKYIKTNQIKARTRASQIEGRKLPIAQCRGYYKILIVTIVGIKNDLVSSWDGMSQLSQITVMFVVNHVYGH